MSSSHAGTLVGPRTTVLLLLGVSAMSLLAIQRGVSVGLAAPFGLVALVLLFVRPDTGTLLFLALSYMNAPVLLGRAVGSPPLAGMAVTAFVGIPIMAHLFKRRGFVFDYTFLLMLLFLGALLGSSFLAVDTGIAFAWVVGYMSEGVVLYFLLLNAVRSVGVLRAAIWTLLLVSAVLSSLGLYQELTGKHRTQFGGLAQRNTEREMEVETDRRARTTVVVGNRAAGPVGGPNRFAQMLIVVAPLAFFRAHDARARLARMAAFGCLLLILAGIAITYSRGGFLTVIGLGLLMILMGYIRWWQMFVAGVLLMGVVVVAAPGFLTRIGTMRSLPQLLSQRDAVAGHGAIRGRLTEMLAAMQVFMDHPVLGVGPGQYTPFYSMKYMENPEISFRNIDKARRSHCLYAELAAETGIVGTVLFLAIVGTMASRLWRLRGRFKRRDPELSHLAAALWLGLVGYLGTAVFLQLAYQRYFWLFLALAGAAVQILAAELRRQPTPPARP